MDASDLGHRLDGEFDKALTWTARSPRRLYVSLAPDRLLPVFDWLRDNVPGLRLGTSTGIDLREGIGVFHHLPVNGTPLVITLKVLASKPEPRLPSLAARIPSARWIEREIHDLLGVDFEGHPDLRRLVKAEAYADVLPQRRDFDPATFSEKLRDHHDD